MLKSIYYDSVVFIAKKSISTSWFLTKFTIINSYHLAKFFFRGILINGKKLPNFYKDVKLNLRTKMELYKIFIASFSKRTDTIKYQPNLVLPDLENLKKLDKQSGNTELSLYLKCLFELNFIFNHLFKISYFKKKKKYIDRGSQKNLT